jgi:hypothetical protein
MGKVEPQFYSEVLRHIDAPIDEVNVKGLYRLAGSRG